MVRLGSYPTAACTAYAAKIILHAPAWNSPLLGGFVKKCLRDKVALICVVGGDCERVHDVIDELIVGDGSADDSEWPATTWHADQSLDEVRSFAASYRCRDGATGPFQEVRLVGCAEVEPHC
jgi:hypothetical protein